MNYEAEQLLKVLTELWPNRKTTVQQVEQQCSGLIRKYGGAAVREAVGSFMADDPDSTKPSWKRIAEILQESAQAAVTDSEFERHLHQHRTSWMKNAKNNAERERLANLRDEDVWDMILRVITFPITHNTFKNEPWADIDGSRARLAAERRQHHALFWSASLAREGREIPDWLRVENPGKLPDAGSIPF
jgi:hypothetical protein